QPFADRLATLERRHRDVVVDAVVGEVARELVGIHARPRFAELRDERARVGGHRVPLVRTADARPPILAPGPMLRHMPFPESPAAFDTMLGVPSNRTSWQKDFGTLVRDRDSASMKHAAGYMFRDLPEVDEN